MPSVTEPGPQTQELPVWRFLRTGSRFAAANMALDEAILIAQQQQLVPPTLRFYSWQPAALSIGYFQQASLEVDFDRLRSRGIGFVRRPTGGRAVLHHRELTYSIVVNESYPGIPAGVEEACRMLSEGLVRGFRRLGLDPHVSGSDLAGGSSPRPASSACFDTPSNYELVLDGRKIAGSSQMRAKGVILQHGSIPLELDADLLFDVLRFADEEEKQHKRRAFDHKATAIAECCRNRSLPIPAMADLEQAFLAGFAQALSIELMEGQITEYEQQLSSELTEGKYASDVWNFRR